MFKNFTILFFLFNYLNTSVFFPEIIPIILARSCSSASQTDEMNSLVEFINDKCLGETDDTPEDEDDDIPDSNKCGGKEGIEDHIYVFLVFQLPVFFDNTNTKIPIRDDGKFVFTFIALHYSPPEIGYSLLG